jgi:hypothetical protein
MAANYGFYNGLQQNLTGQQNTSQNSTFLTTVPANRQP